METLTIAVLTTNYNRWDLTALCVDRCYEHDSGNFDSLVVYDDCSETKWDRQFPDSTTLLRGSPNVGLTKALNIAFSTIRDDIVVLFDSDAYPTTPFCDELKSMFEGDESLGLVALRTIGRTGNRTESYTTEPNIWSLLLGQALYARLERWFADRSGNISVFTCAMAVRKKAFDELGGFDEQFDWLDLDHDFSMRMNRSGWKIRVADQARAFHEGGGTPQLTRHRLKRFYKARWYLLQKFDRIPMRRVVKQLILIRLHMEHFILACFGRMLFANDTVRNDKLQGRRDLIRFCAANF